VTFVFTLHIRRIIRDNPSCPVKSGYGGVNIKRIVQDNPSGGDLCVHTPHQENPSCPLKSGRGGVQ
jgi:hypothetical protein